MKMNLGRTLILLILLLTVRIGAEENQRVLATNSWTAAFVDAAGVDHVDQLAPADMSHPPEYELRPSDVVKFHYLDFFVFAGYESLMESVSSQFNLEKGQMIQIKTAYSPQMIRAGVMAIAEKSGTTEEALQNLEEIDNQFLELRTALAESSFGGAKVLVHFHQKAFIQSLGFEVAGVFGPAPLKAKELAELAGTDHVLIIDNGHNPIGMPISEISNMPIVSLVNFPGYKDIKGEDRLSLKGVIRHNGEQLLKLLQ